jgi:hypothetical protein
MIQVHYARGCTLAEAFYQSVYAPYQLLIVGDPLCRPWADIPHVQVGGINIGATLKGKVSLAPTAPMPPEKGIDHFELFVNGSRAAQCKPGGTLALDTALLPDGCHEWRVVAVCAGLIQSQGETVMHVFTNNYGRKIEAKLVSPSVLKHNDAVAISVNAPGSIGACVLQNSRVVGRMTGEKGDIKIESADLGLGPVNLYVVGLGQGNARSHVLAPPISITVEAEKK